MNDKIKELVTKKNIISIMEPLALMIAGLIFNLPFITGLVILPLAYLYKAHLRSKGKDDRHLPWIMAHGAVIVITLFTSFSLSFFLIGSISVAALVWGYSKVEKKDKVFSTIKSFNNVNIDEMIKKISDNDKKHKQDMKDALMKSELFKDKNKSQEHKESR